MALTNKQHFNKFLQNYA